MHVIIAGGGELGSRLAELLVKEKHDVVVIEKDTKVAERLGEKLDALVLEGDAGDRKVLKDADIDHTDALVSLVGDDKTNLMICEVAKSFNVPRIVSKITDPSNEPIFAKLGITATLNTTTSVVLEFKKALEDPERHLIKLVAGEKAEIIERAVPEGAKVIGKRIEELNFVVAAVYRGGEFVKPKPSTRIVEGDVLTICVPVEDAKGLERFFKATK